ncbi:hypothetical protein [Aurantiacibacter aquimixticola]|uniref:DUF4189 domain-containing protein n=1 Tax=Aurantiacibacter aquimixticola TaxID=1958945 RepID=A0A419RR13_9SPHN|nr:hypothetical protein [Aurantiacibacter aquimixticola]RJY08243.1 hypothetical protein D6201_01715 [Aurantiacibacter aquimixticola]
MKSRLFMIWSAALLLAAGAVWAIDGGASRLFEAEAATHAEQTMSAPQFAKAEALASAACQCRKTGGSDECYSEYDAFVEPFLIFGEATACAPVSTKLDCFATNDGTACVEMFFSVGADVVLCTPDEARSFQAVYDATFAEKQSHEEALAAASTADLTGVADLASSGGCVG